MTAPQPSRLDLAGLGAWLAEHHHGDLLRVETLPQYRSASDGDELARFLRGEPEPDRAAKAAWLTRIRTDTAAGRTWRRLRVLRTPLTDYVRYACEWGYTDNTAAGENVRILDLTDHAHAEVLSRIGDFYLLDHHVAAMHYDPDGTFRHADVVEAPFVPIYGTAANTAWQLGEPFSQWWARHPEHHRRSGATLPR